MIFSGPLLSDYLTACIQSLINHISTISKSDILNQPEDEFYTTYLSANYVKPIELRQNLKEVAEPIPYNIPLNSYDQVIVTNRTHVTGKKITVSVPFIGNENIFNTTISYGIGRLQGEMNKNELTFDIVLYPNDPVEKAAEIYKNWVESVNQALHTANDIIDRYNKTELPTHLKIAVAQRYNKARQEQDETSRLKQIFDAI